MSLLPTDATSYGEMVYESIEDIVGDEFMLGNLSLPTKANFGAYLISAYEIAELATSGQAAAAFETFFDLSMDIVFDIMSEVAGEALGAAAAVVPIAGQLFSVMMGALKSAQQAQQAQEAQEAAKKKAECQAKRKDYTTIPTGIQGKHKPADYFVRSFREGFDGKGQPIWRDDGRPYFGRMLIALTETQFPPFWVDRFTNPATFGLSGELFGMVAASEAAKYGNEPFADKCGPAVFPLIQQYVPRFQRVRLAIESQSIAARQSKGLSAGDGGTAVWPAYADLLYTAVRIAQPPRGLEELPGATPVPPLSEAYIRQCWNGSHVPKILWSIESSMQQDPNLANVCGHPYLTPAIQRAIELTNHPHWCMGTPGAFIEGLLRLVDSWGNTVKPIYADDQLAQEKSLEAIWRTIEEETRQRAQSLGLSGGKVKPAVLIQTLAARGIISQATASSAATAAGHTPSGTPAPLILAAAAVGALTLLRGR